VFGQSRASSVIVLLGKLSEKDKTEKNWKKTEVS
jgi:hypothetical protein